MAGSDDVAGFPDSSAKLLGWPLWLLAVIEGHKVLHEILNVKTVLSNSYRYVGFSKSLSATTVEYKSGLFLIILTSELTKKIKSLSHALCLSHRALTHSSSLTHTSSHAFPCSGPGLISSRFLFWLQAVSFFRSCIYPLGMLTSSEQQFINSVFNSVPPENLFSLYRQNISFIPLLFGFSSWYQFQRRSPLRSIAQGGSCVWFPLGV